MVWCRAPKIRAVESAKFATDDSQAGKLVELEAKVFTQMSRGYEWLLGVPIA